ncbi:MAG: NUDIX domain-containing protein [Candidatus Lambdaproteobacteria bacterium]|nr:NUDIX domain-containing protein [Candidatus Lambdaproteobacteria bacterium]
MTRLRPNVCIVLTDEARRQVLLFHRSGLPAGAGHSWQFPQGGIQEGETPLAAARRELAEETGVLDCEFLAQAPEPIAYLYPPEVRALLSRKDPDKGDVDGQLQHWFLARLHDGGTRAISFAHQPAEFDAFRWASPTEALTLVVPFKRGAYRKGLLALGLLAAEER